MTESNSTKAPPLRENAERARRLRSLAVTLMLVAALFSGVVIGVMAALHLSEPPAPPDSPTMKLLAAQLRQDPANDALKTALQQEDRRLRQDFQTHRRRMAAGAWMLLIGLAITVTCAKFYVSLDPATPKVLSTPAERADADRWLAQRRRNIITVAAGGAIVFAALLIFALIGGRAILPPAASTNLAPRSLTGRKVDFKDNWPRFRGADGTGIVTAGAWPQKWDSETGENIVWKSAVPLPGNSSPVLWGDRVFLTGADRDRQEVFCFDRAGGKLLWRTPIFTRRGDVKPEDITVQEEKLPDMPATTYASPTVATDGERVYATFASADIAAVDFAGNVVWARNLGKPESSYGRSTSLLVFKDKVIVQFDRGESPDDGLSALLALDAKTDGHTVWSTPRPMRQCWCTPILASVDGHTQLIASGSPWVMGYDPDTSAELWRCEAMKSDVAASPTFADGLVYVTNENAAVFAIRPGAGDVTKTNVVWTDTTGMSDTSSPVCNGKFFLQANSQGQLTCFDAKSGKLLWEKLLGCKVWSSLSMAGDVAYVPGDDGKVYIFPVTSDKPGDIATCDLATPLLATPAFGDGRIYIRGKKTLFCIGEAPLGGPRSVVAGNATRQSASLQPAEKKP